MSQHAQPVQQNQQMPSTVGGPIGEQRSTGLTVLLFIVTFGIYGLYWYYVTHEEMKRHTGAGLGGLVALLLAFFVGVVSPFLSSHEVGELYTRRGEPRPVSALAGLWFLLPLVGGIIWFAQTNNALNAYWRSVGATV